MQTTVPINNRSEAVKSSAEKKKKKEERVPIFWFVLSQLLGSLRVNQDCLVTKTGEIEFNAQQQQDKLDLLKTADYKYQQIPDGADAEKIKQVSIYNQQIDQKRALIQDEVVGLRQVNASHSNLANALVNDLSQKSAQTASWLKALSTIAQEINSINKRG